ncbi:MAG: hypothetical protein RQ741_10835 [Wenzhouxiangellaceae bacterium]|nr:hypothetical protein [Wenzhouxiangellaceae bacterium]
MNKAGLVAVALFAFPMLAWGQAADADPRDQWWENLTALCGQAFSGRMTHFSRPADETWLDKEVVIHVRKCSEHEIHIPLHVGENRSRTWVLARTDSGFRLKHDHRHEDGSEDDVTWYGGHSTDPGRASRQTFPVDDYSKALFLAHGLEASVGNFWTMEVHEDKFAYELVRAGRVFRAEFDLANPVEPPPPAWGHE